MGKIYLIRHGETESNKTFRFQGHLDNPLNVQGEKQREVLGKYFQDISLDAIYSSSLQRAQATAEPLAQAHNLKIKSIDSLKEISFGDWEGLSYDEVLAKWPQELEYFFQKPKECRMPNGESFTDVGVRVEEAFNKILEENTSDKNIAIISHGGIIRVQLCALLGMDLNNLWMISVYNASTTCINRSDGRMIIEYINDTHYFNNAKNSDGIQYPK